MALDFQPNLPKIAELLLYLAHQKPGSDKYQAVKFFYLADREHLNLHGRPITSESYFALPYGPVASTAKDLLEEKPRIMKALGLQRLPFETELVQRLGPDQSPLIIIRKPLREVDLDLFSRSDLRVFDEVLKRYGEYDFAELYRLTHTHLAYRSAWGRRGTSRASKMTYDEMIEGAERKSEIVGDIGPIAQRL